MTVQKGFFSRIPSGAYPIDSPVQNQSPNKNRLRQRLMSVLIALAGILLFLVIVAVVAFMCWKFIIAKKDCEECSDMSAFDYAVTDSYVDNDSSQSSETDRVLQSINTNTDESWYRHHPKNIVTTTVPPETSVRAPQLPIAPTMPVDAASSSSSLSPDNNIVVIKEYRRPWYARLPLIGWMFHSEETVTEQHTRITIS